MAKQRYNIKITPLTLVHIGTGEDLTPFDYMVTELKTDKGNRKTYLKFKANKVLEKITKELNTVISCCNIRNLQTSLQNCVYDKKNNKLDYSLVDYPCIPTKEFFDYYKEKYGNDAQTNALVVKQMYRPLRSKAPVIPGSSLKGAIRTAVLNCLANKNKDKATKIEKDIEQGQKIAAQKDPFRCILIGDTLPFSAKKQIVGCVKNVTQGFDSEGKPSLVAKTMSIAIEAIQGEFCHKGNSCDFENSSNFCLEINTPLQNTSIEEQCDEDDFHIEEKFSLKSIIQSCNSFFASEFQKEYDKFFKKACNECYDYMDSIEKLKKTIDSIPFESKDTFLLRVGRYSQIEYITYPADMRRIENNNNDRYVTTRFLFDNDGEYLPLGWCLCKVEKDAK